MDASKLTISPESLRFTKMTRSRRAELRKKNIVDLIKSKPYGTYIPLSQFAAVTAMSTPGSQHIVERMVKKGELTRIDISPKRKAYVVNGEVRVVKPAELVATPPIQAEPAKTAATFDDELRSLAMEFAWTKKSDSLREFVKWVGQRKGGQ